MGELHLLLSDHEQHSCQKFLLSELLNKLVLECVLNKAEKTLEEGWVKIKEQGPPYFFCFFNLSLRCCFTMGKILMLVLNCTPITNPADC